MAFNFAHLLSAACGGAPRRLGRLRRPWARCARLFWGGYQHRKSAFFTSPLFPLHLMLQTGGREEVGCFFTWVPTFCRVWYGSRGSH